MSMNEKKRTRLNPVFWALLLFVVAQVLILLVATRIDPFLEENNIYVPSQPDGVDIIIWPGDVTLPSGDVIDVPAQSSLGPALIYFLVAAAVIAIVLSIIPLKALKQFLRFVFALLFAWGAFIATVFYVPLWLSIVIASTVGIIWFFVPLVWFHNLALILSLASLGAVFGRFITPWTAMILILVIAVYDYLAVRFGFMVWMADRLSQLNALPALVVPRHQSEWNTNLQRGGRIVEADPAVREYSVLGGGDIAFPGLLTASIYFSSGLAPALAIAGFGLLGLVATYIIQAKFLKGRPMPALPPIATFLLAGLLIAI
jgi:presenilin-like A22 family membrane protease